MRKGRRKITRWDLMKRIPVPKARPKKEMNSNDEFEKSIEKRQN